MNRLRAAANRLRREVAVLAVAVRDPRVPWPARLVAGLTVAYALSPIDLIPDVIPVLGLLDDLILVPLGLWLALRLVPEAVMADARATIETAPRSSLGRLGATLVVGAWVGSAVLLWVLVS